MKATQKEVMVVPVQVRKQIEMAMLKMMIPQGIKEIIFMYKVDGDEETNIVGHIYTDKPTEVYGVIANGLVCMPCTFALEKSEC
jgi:hypothetical protein